MKISIDTGIMNEIAAISTEIGDLLGEANAALAPVIEHDDWNCSERDIINERLMYVKKSGASLDESAAALSSAFNDIAVRFTEMEKSIPFDLSDMISGMGSALSEPYDSVCVNAGSAAYAAAAQSGIPVVTDDMMGSYEAKNFMNPPEFVKVRNK